MGLGRVALATGENRKRKKEKREDAKRGEDRRKKNRGVKEVKDD